MTFELYGRKRTFRTNHSGWYRLLELAYVYGWKPRGTIAPPLPPEVLNRISTETSSQGSQEVEVHSNSESALKDNQDDQSEKHSGIPKYFTGDEFLRALENAFPEPVGPYMDYLSNDSNKVSAEDAEAIADAVEKALHFIPDEETFHGIHRSIDLSEIRLVVSGGSKNTSLCDFFSGHKDYLKEFISFCRSGEFIIE